MDNNLIVLVVYPLIFTLVIIIINAKFWINKTNDINLNSNEKGKLLQIFIVLWALMNPEVVYGFIIYSNISKFESFNQNVIFIYSSLIFTSLVIKWIIMYKFTNYISKDITINQKALTVAIFINAIAEIPALAWLVIVFEKIGQMS